MSAFITVTDAAGRVLFRRPATDAEVAEALRAATVAEDEGQAAMERIRAERAEMERTEADLA
jgi:predicted thioredoxin/glutaredoxin